MKTNDLNVEALSQKDLSETNGGIIGLFIGAAVGYWGTKAIIKLFTK